ncbi:unnamed protein product, partial [Polarella glacialis]
MAWPVWLSCWLVLTAAVTTTTAPAFGAAGVVRPECRGLARAVRVRVGKGGVPRYVTPTPAEAPEGQEAPPTCEVSWLSHDELAAAVGDLEPAADLEAKLSAHELLGPMDVILTDSLVAVPFAGRRGRVSFLEGLLAMPQPEDPDPLLAGKELLLSVLLPAAGSAAWDDPYTHEIAHQALAKLPDHTFVDDGLAETYERAFLPYRFSLVADDEAHTVSQAFTQCLGLQTIPLFNGFVQMVTMLPRAIVPYNRSFFGLDFLRATLQDVNYDVGWLWHQYRMLQDQLRYRYSRPFEERLETFACTLCRHSSAPASHNKNHNNNKNTKNNNNNNNHQLTQSLKASGPTKLAFVGVYSAKANFAKRTAVRDTWGRLFREVYGFRVLFFLGRISMDASADDQLVREELDVHNDLVILDVEEGYKMNSQKGLLFLEWCALHVSSEFLVKVDDDVYLRPTPLLALLQQRAPAGYLWGYFDYLSPVPREAGSPFFNTEEAFPFHAFPPYPRGLVRAMSMDVVRGLVAMGAAGQLRMIFGDDPCLGVHLR